MTSRQQQVCERLQQHFPDLDAIRVDGDLVAMEVPSTRLIDVCICLRDEPSLAFAQLTDLCGVDMAGYGKGEWSTDTDATASFSRAVDAGSTGRLTFETGFDAGPVAGPRFVVVTHLLSLDHNVRVRIRCACPDDELPVVPSLTAVWSAANWYERECFDLYGILFDGHDDLRRILTDYGFVGHPFRKDFPLIGTVEMRYDPVKQRVVYEPVSIEPRVLVPRVLRNDSRYVSGNEAPADTDQPGA